MTSLLLSIIYVAFISLGLPDSLLGAAWPVMGEEFGVPLSYAGIVSMIIAGATIVSSLLSNRITHKFGPGLVTAFYVGLTAVALFGFSVAPNFIVICICALPYGFGAGGVDAALNNYVAINFKARHMSWLHCFWGIGASISPYIMRFFLTRPVGWHGGYRAIGVIQIFLASVIFFSLSLWKIVKTDSAEDSSRHNRLLGISDAIKIKGVPFILVTFFGYCGLETTAGLWASSYLVNYKGIDPTVAAGFASLFYLGITGGRFINGFIAEKVGDKKLIRGGIIVIFIGVMMIGLPVDADIVALAGLIIVGLGCAPIYPSIIHSTPYIFGRDNSQAIVGIQMASAYVGSTFMPLLFGFLASRFSIRLYPFFLMVFVVIMIVASEIVNAQINNKSRCKSR